MAHRFRRSLRAAAALLLIWPAGAGAQAPAPSPTATPPSNDRMPNPALWGTSGLMTVPTADILPTYGYSANARYFPINTGLSGAVMLSPLADFEAGLVFGAPPANGFSAIAASLKYRILNQDDGKPVSLAVGASLLGVPDTASYVPGSNVFLMLSRHFDYENTRLLNLHGGFMGGLSGARIVAGLDVPILDFARVELEYLGSINLVSQAVNLGLVFTPMAGLTIEAALMQRPAGTFWDRDVILGVGWRGNFADWFNMAVPSPAPSASPSAVPTPNPSASLQSPALEKGTIRIRAIDRDMITALMGVTVSLKQPNTGQAFEGTTDVNGEVSFERIPIGNYEVQTSKVGWISENRLISVQHALETFIEIPLAGRGGPVFGSIEAAGGGAPGDLDLEVYDAARLMVRRLNLSAANYRIEKLAPGPYTLAVKSAGTERLRINILVKANAESQYDLTLPPDGSTPVATPTPVPTQTPAMYSPPPTSDPTPVPSGTPSPSPSTDPSATPSATPSPSPSAPPGPVAAQIEGTVKIKDGGLLPGVRLELKNDDLLVITLSSNEGRYIFRDIPRGVYRLGVSKAGYKSRAYQIQITRSETMKHDFELEPGQ